MLAWLYGAKGTDTPALVQSQNPDLNRLNDVLQHQEARSYLLARRSLVEAFEIISPKSRRFADALINAVRSAKEALGLVPEYDRDPTMLESGRSLERTSRLLVKSMEEYVQDAGEDR